MSGTETRSIYDSPEEFKRSRLKRNFLPEWKPYLDEQNINELNYQMQMISDSLGTCNKISKRPSVRRRGCSRRPSIETILPPGRGNFESLLEAGEKNALVSYMTKDEKKLRYLQRSRTFFSFEEKPTENGSDEDISWNSLDATLRRTSRVEMYAHEDVNSQRMISVIQRELRALKDMAPSVEGIILGLCETIAHYKECDKCNEKISSSLPWILNRIQKLIKYVSTKRQKSYIWPNDFSYLRLSRARVTLVEEEEEKKSSESKEVHSAPKTDQRVVLGKLEEVDVRTAADGWPGVQLLLEVKPERKKKRFFDRARNKELTGELIEGKHFPTLHLRNHSSAPLVQVLRPQRKPRVLWRQKQEVLFLKEFSFALRLLLPTQPQFAALSLTGHSVGWTGQSEIQKVLLTSLPNPLEAYEVQNLRVGTNYKTVLIKKTAHDPDLGRGYLQWRPHEGPALSSREFLSNAPQPIRELLKAAEEEEMHVQKVRELEAEVKGLKDLMLEVHKNQMELSKVLLEKGVYSQPMIKLTDPNMLEEENNAVKMAANMQALGRNSSVESLQSCVDDLKRKCTVKNRMIVTLLKGLRSDVPKEWWEELVDYMFDESKPIEAFDPEKVSEFIRQTSLFLLNGEKGSRVAPLSPQHEELPSEEEPKARGIVGADGEDLKFLSCNDHLMAKMRDVTSDRFLGYRTPVGIMAFPAVDNTDATIRKLENQISVLNTENDRLWHQVSELRELLKTSINQMNEKVRARHESEQVVTGNPPGKTINLTIQISGKGSERLKDGAVVKVLKAEGGSQTSIADDNSKFEFQPSEEVMLNDQKLTESDQKTSFFPAGKKSAFNPKSNRRRSENDLNYLDDTSPAVSQGKEENEKLRALLRERLSSRAVQQVMVATPHPSTHDMFKPIVCVPSQYSIPEVSDGYRAGPSQKQNVEYLLQKPSLMELAGKQAPGMFAMMANERELQTIPENENADCSPSASCSTGVTQAIQRLRTRVRSMHKDVTVLKSKNDRIDKLLGKLMDDVLENKQSFDDIENDFNHFKERLG